MWNVVWGLPISVNFPVSEVKIRTSYFSNVSSHWESNRFIFMATAQLLNLWEQWFFKLTK